MKSEEREREMRVWGIDREREREGEREILLRSPVVMWLYFWPSPWKVCAFIEAIII